MRLMEELTTDWSAGMLDSAAATRYPRNAAALILNGRVEEDGTVRRRPGSRRLHETTINDDTCYGAIEFTPAGADAQIVAIFGDTAAYSTDGGVNWTEITDGLREDYYSFAIMRVGATNWLYAANGDSTVKTWDGSSWSTLAGYPSGVKYLAEFNRRLYYAGHSGVLVGASKIGDPTTIAVPDGLTVQVQQVPSGLFQLGPHLLVFGEDQTAHIDGFGEQTLIVAAGATGFSKSVGCIAFRSIVAVGDNGVMWLSKRGVEYYVTGQGIRLVSKAISRTLKDIDWSQILTNPGTPSAAYDETEQNYHLALSTTGIRNNRVVVLNIREPGVQYQREGPVVAPAMDRYASTESDIYFVDGGDGYLTTGASGYGLTADANGFASLDLAGDGVAEDADGFLTSVTDDTVPATLFVAQLSDVPTVIHSGGYDGFVRVHDRGTENDDELADGTGGTTVTMTVLSRPFYLRRPRQRKRVRAIHVGTLQTVAATLTLKLRGVASETGSLSLSMAATSYDQPRRELVRIRQDADAPQVQVETSDDVRLAILGISAGLLRERL